MKILYIEDNPADIDLTLRHLKKEAPHIEVKIAKSQAEALKTIRKPDFSTYDLVLTDMHLQDGDGIAVLSHIRAHSVPVPVVLLTGHGDEDSAVAALKAGADDYVVKKSGYLNSLPRLLDNAAISYRETKERKLRTIKVLYVEHNQADVDLTLIHLAKHAPNIQVEAIHSVSEFYQKLDTKDTLVAYDVLMLDYRLPQENALEILKRLHASPYSRIPVILITGKGDEEIAVQALKLGAFDYMTKHQGYLIKLPSVIENAYYSTQLACEHEALLESEKRYRCLFENNHVVMLLIDPENGDIIDGNPAAVEFYGWSREELTSKKIFEINTLKPEEIKAEMQAVIKEKRAQFLFRHRRADQTICDVEVYSGPIEMGGRSLLYSIVYDITQRIQYQKEKEKLQAKLIQAQKMEAVGQLAGGIAHDFNNILSSIIGFTELALEDVDKGTNLEDSLQEVYAGGKRAKDLVKQILAFARQSDEEVKPIQVGAIVREALKFIRSSIPTSIEIKHHIESDSLVMGNATQVHQILMNLCTNAAHAMEDAGGVLAVSLKDTAVDCCANGKAPGLTYGNYIELAVSDTGVGILPDLLVSIFEPYFTTKDPGEGTGMGLAVVHGIVESYGGKIFVDSVIGRGTTFTVYLPITGARKKYRPYEPEKLPAGAERILFVDDEAPIVKMASQVLERLGYSVTTRTSSVEALKLFCAKPDDFDLVISDMSMPNMSGDILAAELMNIRRDIPVVLCTGYSKKISDKRAAEIGIKAFAYKPIIKSDLAKTVRKVLDAGLSETQIPSKAGTRPKDKVALPDG
jgi:PAS domain S-box-containing protein